MNGPDQRPYQNNGPYNNNGPYQDNRPYQNNQNYNNYRQTTYSPQQPYGPQTGSPPPPPRKSYTGAVVVLVAATVLIIGGLAVFLMFYDQIFNKDGSSAAASTEVVAIVDEDGNRIGDAGEGYTSENILYNTLGSNSTPLYVSPVIRSSTVDGTTIPKNAEVELLAYVQDSDFIKVSYNGKIGYTFTACFTREDIADGRYVKYCIARHHANLRSQPGSDDRYNFAEIYTDSPVQCTGEYEYVKNQKYLEVVYRDQTGYVLDAVFSDTMDGPTYRGN